MVRNIMSASALVAVAAACSSEPEKERVEPQPMDGAYLAEETPADGEDAMLVFSGTHYAAWKSSAECRSSEATLEACSEVGRFTPLPGALRFVTDSGRERVVAFERKRENGLTPQAGGLVGGPTKLLTAPAILVGGKVMKLIEMVEKLLECKNDGKPMAGAVPGQEADVRKEADFQPGGRFDPRTTPTDVFRPTFRPDRHRYVLLSDRLPKGTTFDQANSALQRFNGPTKDALSGQGNDPGLDSGWVVDPAFHLPLGCVGFDRGCGWIRNTTDSVHPFIGTIRRAVVDGGDGTWRILTVGDGQGNGGVELGPIVGPNVEADRHALNALAGPWIFQEMDDKLVEYLQSDRARGNPAPCQQ